MVRHAEVTESVALCTFRISKITVEERRPSIVLLFLRSNLSKNLPCTVRTDWAAAAKHMDSVSYSSNVPTRSALSQVTTFLQANLGRPNSEASSIAPNHNEVRWSSI